MSLRNFYAQTEAEKHNGFFINQFGNADRAEEFHESKFAEKSEISIIQDI